MKIKRIRLKGVKNCRDLGGIHTSDGKKIKEKRLIRSGHLHKACQKDIDILKNEYNLKTVVDLRMKAEISAQPDFEIDGVNRFWLSLLDSSFLGIARDKYSVETWLNMFSESREDPSAVFSQMYIKLCFDERVKPFFREFFNILLNNESGSVLWHCSAGKDRVGVLTAVLLSVLGVPRETVISDYLATQKITRLENMKVKFFSALKIHDRNVLRCINVLFSVKPEFINNVLDKIDNDFGGIYSFVESQFGLTAEKVETLKKMYLE